MLEEYATQPLGANGIREFLTHLDSEELASTGHLQAHLVFILRYTRSLLFIRSSPVTNTPGLALHNHYVLCVVSLVITVSSFWNKYSDFQALFVPSTLSLFFTLKSYPFTCLVS